MTREQITQLGRQAALVLGLPLVLMVTWWFLSSGSSNFFFPPLATIVRTFADIWFSPRPLAHAGGKLASRLDLVGCRGDERRDRAGAGERIALPRLLPAVHVRPQAHADPSGLARGAVAPASPPQRSSSHPAWGGPRRAAGPWHAAAACARRWCMSAHPASVGTHLVC